jgi:uncharacterized membrane protein YjjP (DUF1212 family)
LWQGFLSECLRYNVLDTASNAVNARLFAAFVISFIARGLYSHTNHKICYSAVSSGGIVLTLPGFAVSECVLSAGQGAYG